MKAFRGRGIRLGPGFANAAEDPDDDFFPVVSDDSWFGGSTRRRAFCGEGVGNFAAVALTTGAGFFVTVVGVRCGSFS